MISSYGVRFYVLRNGARLTTLSAMSAPSVDCSADAEINVSMAGIFAPSPLVNWLTDEIQPVQVIDGVEHPVGVLVPVSYLDTVDANGAKAVQVEAYDRCYILKQAKLEARLHLGCRHSLSRCRHGAAHRCRDRAGLADTIRPDPGHRSGGLGRRHVLSHCDQHIAAGDKL